jgi:hypothetical protein
LAAELVVQMVVQKVAVMAVLKVAQWDVATVASLAVCWAEPRVVMALKWVEWTAVW